MPWLQWLTRDEDIKRAKVAPYRLLEPAPELSAGEKEQMRAMNGSSSLYDYLRQGV